MTRPWTARQRVTTATARDLIESQFPELAPVNPVLLGEGWDNAVYQVNQTYVFRFPRRPLGVECLQAEIPVLQAIAGKLPLQIPEPLFWGEPSDLFPWPFAGYRLIAGRTACTANLDQRQRTRCAKPLARFLKQLHTLEIDQALKASAKRDELGRLDLAKRLPQAHEYLNRIEQHQLIDQPERLRAIVEEATQRTRAPLATSLVHGDLYARHLVVDDSGQLRGVIDWGDVHIGDPALDLAVVFMFLPSAMHDSFWKVYGLVDEATWHLARFRALQHQAIVIVYAHDIGDEHLFREAQTALRFISTM